MNRHKLCVIKRDGTVEPIRCDAITDRLSDLCEMEPALDISIDPFEITKVVVNCLKDRITTVEIDEYTAEICSHNLINPDYLKLAARLIVSAHHKNVTSTIGSLKFSDIIEKLYGNHDQNNNQSPLISKQVYDFVNKHKDILNDFIDIKRDFLFDYFGFKTLKNAYLLKLQNGTVIECPQHTYLRVAIADYINEYDNYKDKEQFFKDIKETYDLQSLKYFTHATPTMYNAGTPKSQMFSCYLYVVEDSVDGIYEANTRTAKISKWGGGVGLSAGNVRGKNSYVRGTGGKSEGILPFLRIFNETSRYINQGSRRNGSFAVYIEPWHVDIFDFLNSKNIHGTARDLFYGLWIPDIFMHAVKNDGDWYLMCPDECRGLTDSYGEVFEQRYWDYVNKGKYRTKLKAKKIWDAVIVSQIETGTPYMCYKDAVNRKSNHKNIGTIQCSNLCTEIMEYSDSNKYACCCLSSIILQTFVENDPNNHNEDSVPYFNYDKLIQVVRVVTRNLDNLIDANYYPVEEARRSNLSERPIGIGVQGLADVFFKFKYPYDSKEANELNKKIFETIYYAAMLESNHLAKTKGTYKTYEGSDISKGLFQFNLWPNFDTKTLTYDWDSLRDSIVKYGVRNSLVTALMPTASTAQINSSVEAFEPISGNIYTRRVIAGEFIVLNKYLADDLVKLGLWNKKIIDQIIANGGSVQGIAEIPDNLKDVYKTCFELKQRTLIEMCADRSPFIDQSSSLNLFFDNPDYGKISSAHFKGFDLGLKTGSYYIRSKPKAKTEKFTVTTMSTMSSTHATPVTVNPTVVAQTDCEMCSS